MVKELLKAFYQTCGRKPERILFYRDEVSESQFENVKAAEPIDMIIIYDHVYCGAEETPRIFPIDECDTDRSEIVFLVQFAKSRRAIRDAHYYVLYDNNGFISKHVPPVYYAHLVTKRAKLHARGRPLSDTESEESAGGAAVTFGVVKTELQRVNITNE
ncbi:hypothetical protein C1646_663238 [Rhizophagus diaphanus]|nr:hypothetical protein C1646_663238 [Rhizophagus diaphanus] [Rhizophagus sp. MUCL 43196]